MSGDAALSFSGGLVIRRTFVAVTRNAALFSGLGLVLVGLPLMLFTWTAASLQGEAAGALIWWGPLLLAIPSSVLQAAIISATVCELTGRKADLRGALSAASKHTGALFLISIIQGLATLLGAMLLLIPGLFVLTIWAVGAPARVVERGPIFEALSRSRDLTSGHRWAVLALVLTYLLAWGGSFFATSWVLDLPIVVSSGGARLGAAGLDSFVHMIFAVVSYAGASALYLTLRQAKEGVGPEALAKVFE